MLQFLPKFKILEPQQLTGLNSGNMLSQFVADDDIAVKQVGDAKFIENGIFVGLSASGTVENYDVNKHAQLFVHYTEELVDFGYGRQAFAVVKVDADRNEQDAYPRGVALSIGDTVVTNNYSGTLAGCKYAKIVNGVATLQTSADDDSVFIAKESSLANGADAVELVYYKNAEKSE